jgi:hypothetical protein
MTRLTRASDKKIYIVDDDKVSHNLNGYSGDAVNKLALFENMYDDLIASQSEISKELERLRNEDKTHSVKFKELMARKLTNTNFLIFLKTYGLE